VSVCRNEYIVVCTKTFHWNLFTIFCVEEFMFLLLSMYIFSPLFPLLLWFFRGIFGCRFAICVQEFFGFIFCLFLKWDEEIVVICTAFSLSGTIER